MVQQRRRGVKATERGLEKLDEVLINLGDGKRLTRPAIADKILEKCGTHIDESTIGRFLKGNNIEPNNAKVICKALGVPYKEILERDEWNNNQPCKTEINWDELCRKKTEKLRTGATEEGFELDIFVPLGLMERKQQQRRPIDQQMERDQVYEVEEKAEITRRFEHEEFLNYIGLGSSQGESDKNIAIIGEPGAGKTTLLQNLAQIINDQQQGLPICVSLGALSKERSLINYLEEKWLQDALAVGEVKASDKTEFRQLFAKRQVWLILDGLDERSADSPVEALTWIEHEVRSGYLQKARVVVSCRVNVWDANIKPLREFVTYKTLDFDDPQRDRFIEQWFGKKGDIGLGEQLITCLQETGRDRIRELVKNPLRLVLLCQIWSLGEGELPETKAQFDQRYLPYFYEWKQENPDLRIKRSLQVELHRGLGKLAIASLESESRYRLAESFAIEQIGEKLFKLGVDFGWLNIVDRDKATDEAVYAFFHPTFQEFFAACEVKDWDFFLPRNHCDRPVEEKIYRIFEAKWKEVILLWLGRGDVEDEDKEAFIESLVEFESCCSDFYSGRASYLAVAAINEFKICSLGDEIVKKIIGKGNEKTILALRDLLRSSNGEWTLREVTESLEKIGQGNEKAILALRDLLHCSNDESTLREIAESLGQIEGGNPTIILTLCNLLRSANNKSTLRAATDSLIAILQKEQMPRVVTELKDHLNDENWINNSNLYQEIHRLLCECAQTLSYPEFYQAWHNYH